MQFVKESYLVEKNGTSGAVKTKDWLKFICLGFLNLIPLVGTIAYLGILIYIALSDNTSVSMKSYVRAYLIFFVISLVVGLVLGVILGVSFLGGIYSGLSAL